MPALYFVLRYTVLYFILSPEHTVLASVVGPLLCVAGSVGLDVPIVVCCCLARFSLAAPSSLAFQGPLQDGFCNGVVSSDLA